MHTQKFTAAPSGGRGGQVSEGGEAEGRREEGGERAGSIGIGGGGLALAKRKRDLEGDTAFKKKMNEQNIADVLNAEYYAGVGLDGLADMIVHMKIGLDCLEQAHDDDSWRRKVRSMIRHQVSQ